MPLGIAAGRWTWALFAQGLGIPAVAITPVSLAVLTAATAMLLANAIAFWPGRATARLSPAQILAQNDQINHRCASRQSLRP